MKISLLSSSACLALLVFALTGCRSSEQVRREAELSSPSLREGIVSLKPRIDAAMNALLHLETAQTDADVVKTHAAFSEKLANFRGRIEEVRGEVELMERQGLEYFHQSGREFSRAPSAKAADAQAAERAAFKNLQDILAMGRTNMRALVTSLETIDKGVKANPTKAGVKAQESSILAASPQAVMSKGSADRMAEQIEKMLAWNPK